MNFSAVEKAAEMGYASSQCTLGLMFLTGNGVNIDFEKARYWLEKSASSNNPQALLELSRLIKPEDPTSSNNLLQRAAMAGNPEAQFELFEALSEIEQPKKIEMLNNAAKAGILKAQVRLAKVYSNGVAGPVNNIEANRWWKIAALKGDVESKFQYGINLIRGIGCSPDYSNGVWWIRTAANQGFPDAVKYLETLPKQEVAHPPSPLPQPEIVAPAPKQTHTATHINRSRDDKTKTKRKAVTANIVGMQYHPVDFNVYEKSMTEEIKLHLEPDNPYDEHAVAVFILDKHVGYIDKKSAKWVSEAIRQDGLLDIKAVESNSCSSIKIKITLIADEINAPKLTEGFGSGIYKILVISQHKVYIGQSNAINRRISSHWLDLQIGRHANTDLQNAWNNGGAMDFSVEIVELSPPHQTDLQRQRWLGERERYWISHYRTIGVCINIQDGEIVETKAARVQYDAEISQKNRAHDVYVKNRKREISAELSLLNNQINPTREKIADLHNQIKFAEVQIKKSTGLFSGFRSDMKLAADQAKNEINRLNLRIAQLEKSILPTIEKISSLNTELNGLKTTKQIEAANKRSRARIDNLFWRAGINRRVSIGKKPIV